MQRLALGCLLILLLGHILWASEDFEKKGKRTPSHKSWVLETYIKHHPFSISMVLGVPSDRWSTEFRGDHLYIDKDAKDPEKSCLQLSWQSDTFLKDVAPLMGKVFYLYVAPEHFKTKETSALAIERVLALLNPWGSFYYKPHFVDLYDTAPPVYLEAFKHNCLPLEIGVKSLAKRQETSYIRETFCVPIQNLMTPHFKKVTTCVRRINDSRENMYWGNTPLVSGEAALCPSRLVSGALISPVTQDDRVTSISKPHAPLVLGRLSEEKKRCPRKQRRMMSPHSQEKPASP
ncbi:MAG: hypothetical protein H2057_02005 [Alphaproteobacteria bacterium]|nr:hypothetical protein [Alphaproteobacteria bacterium]